ncbi:hypothetical protein BBP40_011744 [Aspergillus hancockii]|nr:hypothetical protein BBP40_011744 [Aspergillus hancockii]
MKFITIAAVALATLASAHRLDSILTCARSCIQDVIKSSSSCGATDVACACKPGNFSRIKGAAAGCVLKACGSDKGLNVVLPAVEKLCKS